jgi:hypothetical protein
MTIFMRGKNWSEQEHAEIGRLEALCSGTDQWSLECDHTDAGDPWCVIYDHQHHRIVLHIARIERRYVVVWPREGRSAETPSMIAAVEMALERLRAYAPAPSGTHRNRESRQS